MGGVERELANELALGAAVALAEWMDGINLAEVEGSTRGEGRWGEVDEEVFAVELRESVFQRGGYELGWREGLVALGDVDDAEFAGPGKDVLEEMAVDCSKVGGGEVAGNAPLFEFSAALGYEGSFDRQ